jgi:hypothetical protein
MSNVIKAIVINEKGAYKHLNGKTLICDRTLYADLKVDRVVMLEEVTGETVYIDFKPKNVLFVDAEKLAQEIYDAKNWGTPNAAGAWVGFQRWAELHGFEFKPEYNCPA